MRDLSIRDAREKLPKLDKLLEREGELRITRRGHPIARVLPIERRRKMPSHAALRQSLPRSGVSSAELVRADRDER